MRNWIPILCVCILGCSQQEDAELSPGLHHTGVTNQSYRPLVTWRQHGGDTKYYQTVDLELDDYSFVESTNWTWCSSTFLFARTCRTKSNTLSSFQLTLRAEPEKYVVPERKDTGVAGILVSRATDYQDLNGDSCFDTMVKYNSADAGQYILHSNRWVQVRPSRGKWEYRNQVQALDSGATFTFTNGEWKVSHNKAIDGD